ncbi:mitochondrial biogenesis AIM24-domain-containing protein [Radiomyces spectabilis]|uniref:mitochondrial biogenesis AIM24-domain-containing protein n=1 Tax=Radiomyces spectabilis TaxID=64574 RepID=UPI00221EEA89|nr:mitochondrial biogenesis AIM24-domain-containing protein [Radiomyces spectabilis]KAI8384833.1 mitochondrial biogenesis AIM24-domain-containing protein [Radiomyces spectabilis]
MPPETEIIAATGTAVGSSSKVSSKLALDDSTVKAIGKKLVGDAMFFQKYATKSTAGDLLLAPTRMGEIAVIQLKGSTKYVLRRDAFLAKTDKVTLNLALDNIKSWDTGIVNKLVHMVSGPGTIAISHYGGLYRVNMAAGEEYLANPRNLIMWDRRTFPTRLNPSNPVIPSPRSPLRRYTVVRNIVDSPSLQPKLQYLHRIVQGLRNYILGAPDLVKLKGPGDFYLASRVEPFFEKSRLLNAVAAANDSTAQIFEQAGLFPSPAASASETASVAPKSKPHPGYANEKSVNGKPSYYAEIGNDGHVEFVSKARK